MQHGREAAISRWLDDYEPNDEPIYSEEVRRIMRPTSSTISTGYQPQRLALNARRPLSTPPGQKPLESDFLNTSRSQSPPVVTMTPKVYQLRPPPVGVGVRDLMSPSHGYAPLHVSVVRNTGERSGYEANFSVTPGQAPPAQKSPGPRRVAEPFPHGATDAFPTAFTQPDFQLHPEDLPNAQPVTVKRPSARKQEQNEETTPNSARRLFSDPTRFLLDSLLEDISSFSPKHRKSPDTAYQQDASFDQRATALAEKWIAQPQPFAQSVRPAPPQQIPQQYGHPGPHMSYVRPMSQGFKSQTRRPVVDDAQARRKVENVSPVTKRMLKSFYKQLHAKEKDGYMETRAYVLDLLPKIPERSHWRILLELADLARREDRDEEAERWYRAVNVKQPLAATGWLDHASFLQDCGRIDECGKVLIMGLAYCPTGTPLLSKCIRFLERYGRLSTARMVLSRTIDIPVAQNWKCILEGALMESRSGDAAAARTVFGFLLHHVWWYGPLYIEAAKLEEKFEQYAAALSIALRGLQSVPRYGPLWFLAFRLVEILHPHELPDLFAQSLTAISRELVWKVHSTMAQAATREGDLEKCRREYIDAVASCPANQIWRVWLPAARSELWLGSEDNAKRLLHRALQECPKRVRAGVHLEQVRLEEFCGRIDVARNLLARVQKAMKGEWKVFLESLLLEMRAGDLYSALQMAREALAVHPGTGRLWAVYVQLCRLEGESKQLSVFKRGVKEVPKSGEVWCEGARLYMDPSSSVFNLQTARHFLEFATQFTPQYGDSFIEMARLVLLESGPHCHHGLESIARQCANADPNYGVLWFHCRQHPLDSPRQVLRNAITLVKADLSRYKSLYQAAMCRGSGVMKTVPIFTFSTAIEAAGVSQGTTNEQRRILIFGNSLLQEM